MGSKIKFDSGKNQITSRRDRKRKVKSDEIFKTPNMVNQPPKMCKIWPSGSQTDMQNQLKTLLKLCTRRNKTNWHVVLIDFRTLRPVYSVPAYLLCVCEVYKDAVWSIKKQKERKNSMIILAYGPTEYFFESVVGIFVMSILRPWRLFLSNKVFFRSFPLRLCGLQGFIFSKAGAEKVKTNQIILAYSPMTDAIF